MRITVALAEEDAGVRVLLTDDLPAEAVVHLLKMTDNGTRQIRASVFWHPAGARDGHWYAESEGQVSRVWDADELCWSPARQ